MFIAKHNLALTMLRSSVLQYIRLFEKMFERIRRRVPRVQIQGRPGVKSLMIAVV